MITINNAVVNSKGTPYFITDIFANIPARAANGTVFISIDTQQIFSYNSTIPSWILIGTGTGGGGGQDLQGVCTIGSDTDTNINIIPAPGSNSGLRVVGANGIDARGANLLSNDSHDSGYIELINKTANIGTIHNDRSISDDFFALPDKSGVPDTFAMLSDLANIPVLGTYTPGVVSSLNISSTSFKSAIFQQVGNHMTVSFSYVITPTLGASQCRLQLTLPATSSTSGGDALASGSITDGNDVNAVIGSDAGGGLNVQFIFTSFAVANPFNFFATAQYLL